MEIELPYKNLWGGKKKIEIQEYDRAVKSVSDKLLQPRQLKGTELNWWCIFLFVL